MHGRNHLGPASLLQHYQLTGADQPKLSMAAMGSQQEIRWQTRPLVRPHRLSSRQCIGDECLLAVELSGGCWGSAVPRW